jgi:hypothetical protein
VHENPVIADVDRDGRAEIVVATNSVCAITCTAPDGSTWNQFGSGHHGITVFKDLRDRWVSTRAVWNQHAYHVTNAGEDGSIPRVESRHWDAPATNAFRMNPIGDENFAAPDLAIASQDVTVDTRSCPGGITLRLTVRNGGAVLAAPGVPIAVYAAAGGPPLAVARTAGAIIPGRSEVVAIPVPSAAGAALDLRVVVNDDGTGEGVVGECDRANNALPLAGVRCPQVVQ